MLFAASVHAVGSQHACCLQQVRCKHPPALKKLLTMSRTSTKPKMLCSPSAGADSITGADSTRREASSCAGVVVGQGF